MTFLGFEAQASHLAGAELSYTCLGNNRYQVTLKLYQDCNGINLPNSINLGITGSGTCSGFLPSVLVTLGSTVEVPTVCESQMSQTNCNSGSFPGFKELTYTGVLDLSIYPTGCTWTLSYSNCCRNGSITNLSSPSSQSLYIETALLDGSITCNSSPSFANMPIFMTCDSINYNLSNSVIEADGDSIVYSLAAPLSSAGSPSSYSGGLTATNPLVTTTGVTLDSTTGQLNFTPSGSQVVVIDIIAEEYRNGVLIGHTRRSTQVVVTTCNNKALSLDGVAQIVNGTSQAQGTSTTFHACPGEDLHFQLMLSDEDATDSLGMSSVYSSIWTIYPNALINTTYPSSGFDSAIVDVLIAGVQNNTFSIGFTDNSCIVSNSQSFGFNILPDSTCVSISGRVAIDSNSNCSVSPLESPFSESIVLINKGNFTTYAIPNSNGYYSAVVDTGNYTVNIVPIHPYWTSCINNAPATLMSPGTGTTIDFPMDIAIHCPYMYVDIAAPVLVRCDRNYYVVNYCNHGTVDALGSYVEITLDSLFVVDSTSIPISNQTGNTYTFNLGNIGVGSCQNFRIYGILDPACDTSNIGITHCATAHIYPDSLCTWNGPSLIVQGNCNADSVSFRILNVGQTGSFGSYSIIEDDIIFTVGPGGTIPAGDSTPWTSYLASGSTYRMEVSQVPNHPWGTQASATIEGCQSMLFTGNPISTGFVNIFPLNDGSSFYSMDCQENVGSWDPNDKQAFTSGYGNQHYIKADVELKYRIRFQNTGTYLATNVVILDTLSQFLDPTTVIPTVSSHAYTWRLLDGGVLEFRFNNIMLPDSGSNQADSHGFIDFRIKQQENNPIGTVIYNQAGIYFDVNPAVITNQVFHTIGNNFIQITGIEQVLVPNVQVKVYPNPFQHSTTIEIMGEKQYKKITLHIFDVAGRQIEQVQNKSSQKIMLQRGNILQGAYFYRLEADGQLLNSGKLIVH